MRKRVLVDTQPQFCLIREGKLYPLWSTNAAEMFEDRAALARTQGSSPEEFKPFYRVLLTVVSDWSDISDQIEWSRVREALTSWTPPEDARTPVWDGRPRETTRFPEPS